MDVINVSYIRLMVLLDTLEYHGIQLYEYIDAHTHTLCFGTGKLEPIYLFKRKNWLMVYSWNKFNGRRISGNQPCCAIVMDHGNCN